MLLMSDAAAAVPIFDGHNDILSRLHRAGGPNAIAGFLAGGAGGHVDLPRARRGGFAGGLFACYVPSAPFDRTKEAAPPVERAAALDLTLALAALLLRLEAASAAGVTLCRSVADIRAAMASGRLAAVLHVEGAEAIGPDLDALEVLHAAGLRTLGPTWSRDNIFGAGVPFRFPSSPDIGPGLTDVGKALVRRCDRLGVLVDCSHLTEQGFWDVAATSTKPLVASHSNAHALCQQSRNLTDRQLAAIRERAGLVGVNFGASFLSPEGRKDLDLSLDIVVAQIEYLAEKVGVDGVALGSDYDGASVPTLLADVANLQIIPSALAARGWPAADIAKLCHGNWLRVLEATWAA
jgi:membrane dipeptidase